MINNAETERFIIPRYQRRLNTVDLHANSPNHAVAFASRDSLGGQFLHVRVLLFPFVSTKSMEFDGISVEFSVLLLTRSLAEGTDYTDRGEV